MTIIHDTGEGSERMKIESYYNGLAYNVHIGDVGSPMCNLFFQGDDATKLISDLEAWEEREPETETRELWFRVLNPYMM